MTVLDVVTWPNKVLETKSESIKEFTPDVKKLVKDMHETMAHARGIGLAANQVGKALRLFVIQIPYTKSDEEEGEEKKDWHDKLFTFINPEITETKGKTRYQEGCLSFPGIYEYVERFDEVWIKALDENGKEFEVHADGLFSICIQHELDHVEGIVFINRMSRLKANLVKRKLAKQSTLSMEPQPDDH